MKFNWGWAIVVVLTLFIAMILQFVYRSFNERIDLVREDYYENELKYQSTIDKERNMTLLTDQMSCNLTVDGILVQWPEDHLNKVKNGSITLYRPSDERLDKGYLLEAYSENSFLIPMDDLVVGKWEVLIDFEVEGKSFYYKKVLIL